MKKLRVLRIFALVFLFAVFFSICSILVNAEGDIEGTTGIEDETVQDTVYEDAFTTPTPLSEAEIAIMLQERGLLKGNSKGDLLLENKISKAEMVVVLSRLLGEENQAKVFQTNEIKFSDVPEKNPYSNYIAWAQTKNIIKGKSPKIFGIKDSLTGWQAKAVVLRAMGYTYINDSEVVQSADALGITKDVESDDNDSITRGTVARFMYNSLYASCSDGQLLAEKLRLTGLALAAKLSTGNSAENVANGAFYSYEDSWTYFACMGDGYKIYKKKLYNRKIYRLNNDNSAYINVVNGWIYYQNNSDGGKIYKITTSGKNRTKVNDELSKNIIVIGNTIYYTGGPNQYLSRIGIDGKNYRVISTEGSSFINVVGDSVLYDNLSDGKKIYRTSIDGQTPSTKLNDNSSSFISIVDEKICYINSDDKKIYVMNLDGTQNMKVTEDEATCINTQDGWIYYSNGSDEYKIYKIKINGKQKTKVMDNANVGRIFILGEQVAYLENDSGLLPEQR